MNRVKPSNDQEDFNLLKLCQMEDWVYNLFLLVGENTITVDVGENPNSEPL